MTVLSIEEWPSRILETKSVEVTEFDDDFRQFVADMHETMDNARGIGLAANQVGVAKRVLTIYIPWSGDDEEEGEQRQDWHDVRYTFVNPRITKRKEKIRWQEGCLSFPEIFEFVDRSAEVWVEAMDEHGEKFEVHATGLFSVCLQHEIDHLDGITFMKRVSRLKAGNIRKKMLRRGKLAARETELT